MDSVRNIRPLDYVLTAAMVALAVFIGVMNVTAGADTDMAHPLDTHSPWLVAVFVLSVLPLLWRRRNILAAIGVSFVVIAASVPILGWVTRCGYALPLAAAMAYAVARYAGSRRNQVIGLVGILALQVVTLVQDASTGGLGGLSVGLPAAALCYGVGLLVQNLGAKKVAETTLDADRVHA